MTYTFIFSILPLIISLVMILLRCPPAYSALVGILSCSTVIYFTEFSLSFQECIVSMKTVLILLLSVTLVIIPGQYLNLILKGKEIISGITGWIDSLPLTKEKKAVIIVLGVAPTVESLTGFGVSLFLTIPLMFHLYKPPKAYFLSMLSMNIMPWGTLGLATIIGSNLINESIQSLGIITSLTSFLVFPLLGVATYGIIFKEKLKLYQLFYPLSLGAMLSISLYLNNKYIFVETAGVFSGLLVTLLGGITAWKNTNDIGDGKVVMKEFLGQNKILLISPYFFLITLIIIVRSNETIWLFLSKLIVLKTTHISFSIFTSPGWLLLMTAIFAYFLPSKEYANVGFQEVIDKSSKVVLNIFLFLVLAQLMKDAGLISYIASSFDPQGVYTYPISSFMGMVSGYCTGSNVGGNALLMNIQHQIGTMIEKPLLVSAIQNSAAGHAAFASIPMILLIVGISNDSKSSTLNSKQIQEMTRFGLIIGGLLLLSISIMSIACSYVLH